jgi:hypothetical protein
MPLQMLQSPRRRRSSGQQQHGFRIALIDKAQNSLSRDCMAQHAEFQGVVRIAALGYYIQEAVPVAENEVDAGLISPEALSPLLKSSV